MAENIASHVLRCLAAFRPLLEPQSTTATPQKKPLEPKILTVLTDEFSRFKVWSGTIGAHKTGSSSLDYRLRDASHIRDQVLNLVIDLISMLSDVIAITAGEITPWDELDEDEDEADLDNESDEDSPKTELEQIATDIVDVVNGLLRLSVDIKNPAPHPRFLETKLTDKTYFEPFDIQHVSSKFNNIDPWLAERLGKSISRRRQYFKYRETHHEKLSAGLETALLGQEVEVHQKAEPKDSETIASSIPLAMKDSTIMTIAQPAFIKDDQSDAGISHTSYATSAAASGNLKIPPLPDQAYKGPFQCPFCYTMIVARDRNAWKKHVYGDLKPYTCLVEDCIAPERGFGRRHEWMEHVQQNHWHTYSCPFGSCNTPLKSMSECKAHFKTHQSSESTQSGEIEAYIKLAKRPLDITAGIPCPLCHETITSAKQYQSHVGRHQEQLSLFALPSADNEDRSDDDQDSNTASARSRSDASIKSVTRISSGIPLSEIDEDEQEALRDQEELHEYEEYRQAMEEEAEIDERKQGALREEYEETRQLEEHRLVAEKEESRTVGFCHTCKKEEYSSDGTDECAVCGSKLKIVGSYQVFFPIYGTIANT
ncbi:hypothetical protein B0T21DRAFT_296735 [Apiosordaria backusii]|uniref:C2H2-type domain-containing protein n=1 Tax=Apiosordaria backusii TaxID=314023 RepID=A0AA40DV29_9PEZI|nr:hypothetical protein B0T21DRAFT_296735 [Apiosordaria backusii]